MKGILGLAAFALCLSATSAHAWTLRKACDSPASYVHNIGTSTAGLVGACKDVIPTISANGEGLGSYINFAAAGDFVGSFVCLAVSDKKYAAATPCAPNAYCGAAAARAEAAALNAQAAAARAEAIFNKMLKK